MSENENAKWGAFPSTPTNWVKARVLAETKERFTLLRITKAQIKGRPSYVLNIDGDRAFSVSAERSTLASQIERHGMPPAGTYHMEAHASERSPSGVSLVLVAD